MRFTASIRDSRIIFFPFVEDGTLILIGATTENPYFEVNSALISRSVIFELKPLTKEDVGVLLNRAVYDKERGMGSYDAVLEPEAEEFLADIAGGDARKALNAIELAVLTTERSADGKIHITREVASECIQKRVWCSTIRPGTTTTTRSLPLSRVCGAPIPMPRSIIWPGCSMPGEECDLYCPAYHDLCLRGCGKR